LARELEPFGIRVTLVEPGGFRTDFAGRSRTESRCRIDDYDASVGACRRRLLEHAGKERGDPQRAAAAILMAVDADQPPLRLLLGTDALTYVDRKITAQLSEIERWRHVSRATDYPSPVPD
jgi:NAD(P)-dependent dehydrogenase (short-subunit alcohol dehydrogenase family)